MGVDRAIDITVKQRKIVTDLLERHLPDTAAWIYGSRVKWTARPQSDLDMVVFATPEQNGRVSDLREAFEESNLPFRVDLFVWDAVPEQFRKQIKSEHVVLVESGARDLVGEWPTDRFGRLLTEPVRNGIYKRKEFHGRGAKIVNMGELFAHPRLRAVPMKRLELSESENDRFLITAGDLLFARRSLVAEGAGKCCAVLNVDEPTTFESSIIRARPDPTRADYLYLYYFFNSALGLYHLDTIRRQVAVAGITGSDLTNLDIPVPPLPEQRAIAHILGALDDKIELNRRMNETLEAMARALFKSWFVDFEPVRAKMAGRDTGLPQDLADLFPDRMVESELGKIPEGWEVKTFSECVEVVRGLSYKGSGLSSDGVPMHNLNSIYEGGGYKHDGLKGYDGEHKSQHVVRAGDLIVANTEQGHDRLLIGYAAIVPTSFVNETLFSHHIYRVRPKDCMALTSNYLCQLLNTRVMHEIVSGFANGTTVNMLPVDALQTPQLIVPAKPILAAFNDLAEAAHRRHEEMIDESRTLAALRDALLPNLISGELRVRGAKRFIARTT